MPSDVQGVLSVQGFSGALGDRAVTTGTGMEVHCGLGWVPDRRVLRDAVRGLGLAPGSRVHVSVPASSSHALLHGAIAELLAAGFEVRGSGPGPTGMDDPRAEAQAIRLARDWTNASGGTLTPVAFAGVAREVAHECGLSVDVWDRERLQREECGAILAVGQGSMHEPCLIDIRYEPQDVRGTVALVGKGVTFDSGGLSLKSPSAMASMRMDKVGAATVLAVMSTLRELEIPLRVRGILPMAENMIGSKAVRPGDIVQGRARIPITIVDTDFEGRVLMSDALALASEEDPDCIIDLAALTYQVTLALGMDIAGLFSNDDVLSEELMEAAASAGEGLWRLPLARQYEDQVSLGDGVKNHPESDVGRAITAALFLQRFVRPGIPWAHLDISGPAWSGPASGPGATGFGVGTLLALLRNRAG
ncbi:MAG: leucyl aminopeptidase family protein [Candidatus Nanopelagicales bacterium]